MCPPALYKLQTNAWDKYVLYTSDGAQEWFVLAALYGYFSIVLVFGLSWVAPIPYTTVVHEFAAAFLQLWYY